MAGLLQGRCPLRLLPLVLVLVLTEAFELKDEEWEELSPDMAALHRLRGLSQHMSQHKVPRSSEHRDASTRGRRVRRSILSDPMSWLHSLQKCDNVTDCVVHLQEDFDSFLAGIEEQKVQDWLIGASEISHSYNQQLLVMTDQEESTKARVQQEYSSDPHYSVIISRGCLHNDSCLPQVDGSTVVKIFGHVSEDRQTVSGLSGSSLGTLMLETPLKDAPVFSVDGNMTRDFQHGFIRVSMARALQTVLEVKEKNHHLYQVMDGHESVSSYRIPQRPVDHSTQYDHQQILMLENDPVVKKAAIYLYEKHPTASSIYVLDQNHRPKLIHGGPTPLSEDSRLVLVGHGGRDQPGQMRLSGFAPRDVAEIVGRTSRVGDTIKTTSVVGCEVGSDPTFVESLLREIRSTAGIQTELHLRDAVVQVRHTGEKITQEITRDGLVWRHKDDSTKVVASLDRNGEVVIRTVDGSKGEAIFTNEGNFLGNNKNRGSQRPTQNQGNHGNQRPVDVNIWPEDPQRFINPEIFRGGNKYEVHQSIHTSDELQSLTWGLFHSDTPSPRKVNIDNQPLKQQYVIAEKEGNNIRWLDNEEPKLRRVLQDCYEVKSGEDVRNVIRHFGKNGEKKFTYLMVNDWICAVDPKSLYVFPVGKKLDNNQMGNNKKIQEVKTLIEAQVGKETYAAMRNAIRDKGEYIQYVRDIFQGRRSSVSAATEAWYVTYFTASVISESARNFRTFPLVLMALDMPGAPSTRFFFEDHSMARGGSWINQNRRGFFGAADPEDPRKLNKLKDVLKLESDLFTKWEQNIEPDGIRMEMSEIAEKYKVFPEGSDAGEDFHRDYRRFREMTERDQPQASGALGGYEDGHVSPRDLNSASELEKSFIHESYYSRASASIAEEIHVQLRAKYGASLSRLRVKEGTARVEDGQFLCQLVWEGAETKPVVFRAELSAESRRYNEKLLKNMNAAVDNLELQSSKPPHHVNKYVERTGDAVGDAVGVLGLMLGMSGAVRAFEHGDVQAGVVGTLQTAHGVAAMTTAAIAKQALSTETRVARAATAVMRSPAMRRAMTAIPIVGIGFGIYSLVEDLKRGDTLGYIDAALDAGMIALDIAALAVPELAPVFIVVNLALSVVRIVIDDVYMAIKNELDSLPPNAGVLQRLGAVFLGFGKGVLRFAIRVASIFYNWGYEEIEEGRRLVAQISDHHDYYRITSQDEGGAIDFSAGPASWNGGGINFCLADQGPSTLCMDYFVSSDESLAKRCWPVQTAGSKDIILGLGESHSLTYKTVTKKFLMLIPVGSFQAVSGYQALSYSRYGTYRGNRDSNRFIAAQKAADQQIYEVMLSYYYNLYGESGDDTFFLGPQTSYVEGSGGKDTYIIPENGGKTIINNYDPSKAVDTLHFSVHYSHISVSKSGNDVVLRYEGSHTVTVQNWFLGEPFRHMNLISGDGVLFEVSSTVVSSVQLVARGINRMLQPGGATVDASQPLLQTVTSILGSPFDDILIGNTENNVMDGGGGRDRLIGGEGEDIYVVKGPKPSTVRIDNQSRDNKTDLLIVEAKLHAFKVTVQYDDAYLTAAQDGTVLTVILVNWFRSAAHRHLLVITKDMVTFSVSEHKADCRLRNTFSRCIKSHAINYSHSSSALAVDLQEDGALDSVTEVRGSNFNDVIKGNKEHNVLVPGNGVDYIEGRGGEDWYVIAADPQGRTTINNLSPDLVMDVLFLKEQYEQDWFLSKNHQHLQVRTSDGVTAGLKSNASSCGETLLSPLTVDYRAHTPGMFWRRRRFRWMQQPECFTYSSSHSQDKRFCGIVGEVMDMSHVESVQEMYGSPGFDIMVGNAKDNLLDPYTGGAVMTGGEGKDRYIIKRGYGEDVVIDNFAGDGSLDTVLVDMDFLHGGQVLLRSFQEDLSVAVVAEGERLAFRLLNYTSSERHQHVQFESSDGVHFRAAPLDATAAVFEVVAFKVTIRDSGVDCHLDLSSQRNLSKVHTVHGCPSQSTFIGGNHQHNSLIGGWKNDTLDGGDGDDTLIGGSGGDILIGGPGDDTLYGEDGDDTLMGNTGRDVFIPGPGADVMDGGPGRDTVLYRGDHQKREGVYVNLLTGQGRHADAEGDVLKDIETVIGTIYPDILVSGYESSLLKGSDGDDVLVSTGDDFLVGGDGHDVYMLAFSDASVTIDNCAEDNATDVLYLSPLAGPYFHCEVLPDGVLLTFGLHQTIRVLLRGWITDHHQCGHLVVAAGGTAAPVDRLLQACQLRLKEAAWSLAVASIVCVGLLLFHCALIVKTSFWFVRAPRQQELPKELEPLEAEPTDG